MRCPHRFQHERLCSLECNLRIHTMPGSIPTCHCQFLCLSSSVPEHVNIRTNMKRSEPALGSIILYRILLSFHFPSLSLGILGRSMISTLKTHHVVCISSNGICCAVRNDQRHIFVVSIITSSSSHIHFTTLPSPHRLRITSS